MHRLPVFAIRCLTTSASRHHDAHHLFDGLPHRNAHLRIFASRAAGAQRHSAPPATVIKSLCLSGRVDQAMKFLEEMRVEGTRPDSATCCNPIVYALAQDRRFADALGMIERYPLYGIAPDTFTYHPLIKGFCKSGDLDAANGTLKMMMRRGLNPTSTTYSYFFKALARSGRIDECMDLYGKLIRFGYVPDQPTYRLLIEMLHKDHRLEPAVGVIRDMIGNGYELDLETSTILVDLLCRLRRWDEAYVEFEAMIFRKIMPRHTTYSQLVLGLRRMGMKEMARKVSGMMGKAMRSKEMRTIYLEHEGERPYETRRLIFEKAKAVEEELKVSKDHKRVDALRGRRTFFRRLAMRR